MKIDSKRPLIGLVVFVLLPLVSFQVFMITAEKAFMSWSNYDQPYKPILPPVPLIGKNPPLGNHVVIIVIDGARPDIVKEVNTPNIDWIKRNGIWFANAYCYAPSLSLPGYTTIGTGARPAISGITSNWHEGHVKIDNIFNITLENNRTTALVSSSSWMDLFGPWITWNKTREDNVEMDEVLGPWAVEMIKNKKPTLLVVDLYDTDNAGHMTASALSEEYRTELEEADVQIGNIIDVLNETGILSETLIIVASNHGFLSKGYHGGAETEAMHVVLAIKGPGIVSNVVVARKVYQDVIAEIVCVFLGYRIPTGVTGEIPFEVFNITDRVKAAYEINMAEVMFKQAEMFVNTFEYTNKYASELLEIEDELDVAKTSYIDGKYVEAFDIARESENLSKELINLVRDLKHKEEVLSRLRLAIIFYVTVIVPVVVCIWLFRRKIDWKIFNVAVFSMLGYFLGFWSVFAIQGLKFSVSVIADVNELQNGVMASSIAGLIVGGIFGGFTLTLLGKDKKHFSVVIASTLGLLMALAANTTWITVYIVKWNVILDWYFLRCSHWNKVAEYYVFLLQNVYASLFFALMPVTGVISTVLLTKTFKTQQ